MKTEIYYEIYFNERESNNSINIYAWFIFVLIESII